MEPTALVLWTCGLLGVLGVLSAVLPILEDAVVLGVAFLGIALILDFVLAKSPKLIKVERVCDSRQIQGRETTIQLRSFSPTRVNLHLVDTLPEGATSHYASCDHVIHTGEEVTDSYSTVFHDRGTHPFGRMTLRTRGPLGLIRRRERRLLSTNVHVVPDLVKAGTAAERFCRGRQERGNRREPMRQDGREFESLREFQTGDDRRFMEWKASARRMQWITRRLQPEQQQDIIIAIDHGRHLAGDLKRQSQRVRRLDVAVEGALHLAATALLSRDRAGFISFASDISSYVPPKNGRSHLSAFGDAALNCQLQPQEADYGLVVRFIQTRVSKRSWIAFFTDVVDAASARAFVAASSLLKQKHYISVFAVGDPLLMAKASLEDDSTHTRAARNLLDHRRQALAAIATTGVQVIDLSQSLSPLPVMQSYSQLKKAGRL